MAEDCVDVRGSRRVVFAPISAIFDIRRACFPIDQERSPDGTPARLAFTMSIRLHGAETKGHLAAAIFVATARILWRRTGKLNVQTPLRRIVARAFLSCRAISGRIAFRRNAPSALRSTQTQLPRHTVAVLHAFRNAQTRYFAGCVTHASFRTHATTRIRIDHSGGTIHRFASPHLPASARIYAHVNAIHDDRLRIDAFAISRDKPGCAR
jgi:hypothetical protein